MTISFLLPGERIEKRSPLELRLKTRGRAKGVQGMVKKLAIGVAQSIALATIIVFSFVPFMAAGPTKLTPDNPKWGDMVMVTYDPTVTDAKFLPGDTVYIYYELKFPGLSKNGWAKMDAKDGRFKWETRIPEGSCFIYMYFITMDGSDQNAELRLSLIHISEPTRPY